MSTPINDGGPAFPVPPYPNDPGDGLYNRDGMSLRDWFAGNESLDDFSNPEGIFPVESASALAGEEPPAGGWKGDPVGMLRWEAKWRAALKYIRAEAMVAESNRRKSP